jgi:hypothetical protein
VERPDIDTYLTVHTVKRYSVMVLMTYLLLLFIDGQKLFAAVVALLIGTYFISNGLSSDPQGRGLFPGQTTSLSPRTAKIIYVPIGLALVGIGVVVACLSLFAR